MGHAALPCLRGVQSFLEQNVGAGGDSREALQGMEGGVSGQEDGRIELRIKSESRAGLDSCSR